MASCGCIVGTADESGRRCPINRSLSNCLSALEADSPARAISLASGRKSRLRTGFSAGRPGRWRPDLLSDQPTTGERLINLVKLHGSATWKLDAARQPIETGWSMPTDHDCLLCFGYKSVPEQNPFVA